MASATITPHVQRYRTPPPRVPTTHRLPPEVFRTPSPANSERRRASSEGDTKHYAPLNQDYQNYQIALRSDFYPSAEAENFSSRATYGGEASWDLISQSDFTGDLPVSIIPSTQSLQCSLYSESCSTLSTCSSASNSKTQKYIPPYAGTAPAAPSTATDLALYRVSTAPSILSATTPPTVPSVPTALALSRATTAPIVPQTRAQSFEYHKAAYCPRCLFWLNPSWAEAESLIKCVPFVDPNPKGLNPQGLDKNGHLRINDKCCPVCERERYIIKHSPDFEEEDFLMEQLDQIINVWTSKGLIQGMTPQARQIKESIMAIPKPPPRPKTKQMNLAAASAAKTAKKVRDMGLPVGIWEAMEIGLELTAELLEAL